MPESTELTATNCNGEENQRAGRVEKNGFRLKKGG